jgi:hypothetical protein
VKEPQDPFQGEEWDEFVRHVIDGPESLTRKIYTSAVGISLVPKDVSAVDVQFAIELGFMIMFNKPIVAVVLPGAHVPEQLRKVARIVEADLNDPASSKRLAKALSEIAKEVRDGE